MKLTQAQLNELFKDGKVKDLNVAIVKQGDWTQEGRWQKAEIIFTDGDKSFKAFVTRAATPKEDWLLEDYGDAKVEEVRKMKKTIDFWEVVVVG
ncbi:hypothetical protein EHS13_20110 [Paenibacillus psychroresistens]|uniref:Uncharacterized protein n=1 Tax=Paenibacillus psychroresistens TaxID=1778678 RepID=A0A6B8RNB0_9BACL|nr:hypothetical protein [Paenibacillus psychroresistens]QGQ97023.1 hypothetical protein EHS13_20110 [Paenibacillus psychroresistens]